MEADAHMARFSTVGHSNHGIEEFIDILRPAGIEAVADVRRFPRSRSNPVYNIEALPASLAEYQIGYHYMPDLGGRRGRQKDIPGAINAHWQNASFHNYADYALSTGFAKAFDSLVTLGEQQHLAIMCAEAVWWRCHRRIIADHLILAGHEVVHLMGSGKESPARLTPGAVKTPEGNVVYPAN